VIQSIRGPYDREVRDTCTFHVSFSEAVTGVDATDFDVLDGVGLRVGRLEVTGAEQNWMVTASQFTGLGQLNIALRADNDIRDADGNAVIMPANSYMFEGVEPEDALVRINAAIAGDFDGDGTDELAVHHSGGVSLIRVQDGAVQQQLQFTISGLELIGAVDLTGDGRDELISTDYRMFFVHGLNQAGKLAPIFTREFGNVSGTPVWFTTVLGPDKGIGDFNGDGHLDQIVSFSTGSFSLDRIQVMVGDGTGRFVDGQVLTTSFGSYSAAHRGDFNADGRPDLLLETFANKNYTREFSTHVYHGQPGGSLAYQRSYTGRQIHRLADLNGDGRVDIIGHEFNAATELAVFFGAADGTFGSGLLVPASSSPNNLVIQDVDSDGQQDIVVASLTPDGCELNFYRQIVDGSERSFSRQSTVAIPHGGSPSTGGVHRVSLVGSGNQVEVRCTSASWVDSVASRVVQITIGSGPDYAIMSDVIYSLNKSTYSSVPHVRSVFDADLNGDGVPDTVLLSPPRGQFYPGLSDLRLLLRNPTGVGSERIAKELLIAEDEGNDAVFIAAGTLDADGIPDVVTVSPSASRVNVKNGLGDGRFAASRSFAVGGGAGAPFIHDFNGDGRRDIGVANSADNSISLLLGQPDGDFARLDSVISATPTASFAADATGDGKTDLLLLIGTTQLGLLPGQGDGTFGALRTFEAGLQATLMQVGDLNSDGHPDVVLASPSSSTLVVMRGSATGYSISANLANTEGVRAIRLGDWNGDGHPDLIVAGASSANLTAWHGSASGELANPAYAGHFDSSATHLDLQLADFNGGGPELLVMQEQASVYRSYFTVENLEGAIRFGSSTGARGYRDGAFVTADFTGDGRTDIAIVDSYRDSVRIVRNRGGFGEERAFAIITDNLSPSIDPIDSVTIPEDTVEYRLQLTGITSGDGAQQPVRVVASSDSNLLPNPTFVPGSVSGTGDLVLRPTRALSGVVTVTVVVEDAGPDLSFEKTSDNRKVWRFFTLTVTPIRSVITQPVGVITDQRPLIEWSDLPEARTWKIYLANATTGRSPLALDNVSGRSYRPILDVGIGLIDIWVHGIRANGTAMPWSLRHRIEVRTAASISPMAARQTTLRPTAEFSVVPGANAWEVYLSNLSNPQAPALREIVNTPNWTPGSDLGLMRYRLYARAVVRDKFAANWSPPRDFVVAAAPSPTAPLQISTDQRPVFSWTAIPGATNYWLQLRHIVTGKVLADVRDLTATTWQPATPLSFGPYRWWVLAENKTASLRSDWSRGIDITIGDRPALTAPSGFVNTAAVTVRWLPFPQEVTYQLWISQTTPTLQQVFYQSGISGTFHEVAGLKRGTAYRVWVRAILSSTTSTYWSQPLDFTIV
jgi:hypothetical protein